MKFSFEVGTNEKHQVEFQWSKWLGVAKIYGTLIQKSRPLAFSELAQIGKSAEGVTNRQEIKAILASAPVGMLAVVLVGWALGSVVGGFLATLISRKPPGRQAIVLGALLTLAGVANNLMLPPPFWFWIATFAVLLPPTYVGARLVPRQTPVGAASGG